MRNLYALIAGAALCQAVHAYATWSQHGYSPKLIAAKVAIIAREPDPFTVPAPLSNDDGIYAYAKSVAGGGR